MYIKIGDKDVEYSKNFRLFLHTKLSKPHYPPEIQAETTLINFAVTEQVSHAVTRPPVAATCAGLCVTWQIYTMMPCSMHPAVRTPVQLAR
jgi:hypothetical protein